MVSLAGFFRAASGESPKGEPSDLKLPCERAKAVVLGYRMAELSGVLRPRHTRPEGGRGFCIWAMVAAIYVAGQSGVFRA
jgi:hypothetical protein